MKIQSSLLILAAMVGSATAANKRKRVFKIYSREEIRAAEEATRSLQKDKPAKDEPAKNEMPVVVEAVPAVQSMSMTLSPSGAPVVLETPATPAPTAMSMMTKCTFCDGMEFDPELDLGVQDQTCGTIHDAAIKLDATDANCAKAQIAETICCPPELVLTPPEMSMPITTAATTVPATEGVPTTLPAEEGGDDKEAPVQGVPSGAMTMESTFAAITIAGAMLLV